MIELDLDSREGGDDDGGKKNAAAQCCCCCCCFGWCRRGDEVGGACDTDATMFPLGIAAGSNIIIESNRMDCNF
jgi:hypothetical protein